MGEAAIAELEAWKPRVIKISNKRQVTIPVDVYEGAGFSDYALASWTKNGLMISPIDVRDEKSSVDLLRSLYAQGFEGEDLIDEYEKIYRKIIAFDYKVEEALEDVEQGRTRPFEEVQTELRTKYGL